MDGEQLQAIFEQRGYQIRNPTPQDPAAFAVLRDGTVIQRISLFALREMSREEVMKLVDRLDKHRIAQIEQVLHQCIYGHKWRVTMPYSYQYIDPRWRFCPYCLEEDRIEVASIQLTTQGYSNPHILYTCPLCEREMRIPLIPDGIGLLTTETDLAENFYTPRTGWWRLPKRWPTLCEHRAGLEGV